MISSLMSLAPNQYRLSELFRCHSSHEYQMCIPCIMLAIYHLAWIEVGKLAYTEDWVFSFHYAQICTQEMHLHVCGPPGQSGFLLCLKQVVPQHSGTMAEWPTSSILMPIGQF